MAQVHDLEVDDYLYACVSIDENDLDGEFRRASMNIAYWAHQYSVAVEEELIQKRQLEEVESIVLLEIRETMRQAKQKITVDEINAEVMVDKRVRAAHLTYVEAVATKVRLKGTVEAVNSKRDMLQSIGAKLRMEMQIEPRIYDPRETR